MSLDCTTTWMTSNDVRLHETSLPCFISLTAGQSLEELRSARTDATRELHKQLPRIRIPAA